MFLPQEGSSHKMEALKKAHALKQLIHHLFEQRAAADQRRIHRHPGRRPRGVTAAD